MLSIKTCSTAFLLNPVVFLLVLPFSCVVNRPPSDKEPVIKLGQRVWTAGEIKLRLRLNALSFAPLEEAKTAFLQEMWFRSLVETWAEKNKVQAPALVLSKEEKALFGHDQALLQAFRDHKSYMSLYSLFLKETARQLAEPPLREQKKFYHKNKSLFFEPPHCFLKQIVVKKKKQALVLRRRIEEGEDFDFLSRVYSRQKPVTGRVKKGDLEVFDRVCFGSKPTAQKLSFKGKVLSRVVKSPYGYHIFLIEGIGGGRQKSFPEARGHITALLRESALRRELKAWLQKEKETGSIWLNQKLWNKLVSAP